MPRRMRPSGITTRVTSRFTYDLAQKFAISDRYFASVLGPTFPNRAYLMAATSFGHLTTNDSFPPPGGYKPVTGTIFDLLNKYRVSWADYFQDAPQAASFLPNPSHFLPLVVFLAQAAGFPGLGSLPQVSIPILVWREPPLRMTNIPPPTFNVGRRMFRRC